MGAVSQGLEEVASRYRAEAARLRERFGPLVGEVRPRAGESAWSERFVEQVEQQVTRAQALAGSMDEMASALRRHAEEARHWEAMITKLATEQANLGSAVAPDVARQQYEAMRRQAEEGLKRPRTVLKAMRWRG